MLEEPLGKSSQNLMLCVHCEGWAHSPRQLEPWIAAAGGEKTTLPVPKENRPARNRSFHQEATELSEHWQLCGTSPTFFFLSAHLPGFLSECSASHLKPVNQVSRCSCKNKHIDTTNFTRPYCCYPWKCGIILYFRQERRKLSLCLNLYFLT